LVVSKRVVKAVRLQRVVNRSKQSGILVVLVTCGYGCCGCCDGGYVLCMGNEWVCIWWVLTGCNRSEQSGILVCWMCCGYGWSVLFFVVSTICGYVW